MKTKTPRKIRKIAKGLYEVDTCLLVQFHPPQPTNGHHKKVGVWKDMRDKIVGYTLDDCLAVAKTRRRLCQWPFPIITRYPLNNKSSLTITRLHPTYNFKKLFQIAAKHAAKSPDGWQRTAAYILKNHPTAPRSAEVRYGPNYVALTLAGKGTHLGRITESKI